jgi:hypothetical protein
MATGARGAISARTASLKFLLFVDEQGIFVNESEAGAEKRPTCRERLLAIDGTNFIS